MCRSSFKYNLTFIVLFFGITLVHADGKGEGASNANIILYYTEWSAQCRSVMMIGRMLNITFNMIRKDLEAHEQYAPEYEEINPLRQVPVINDKGFILWESRAIMVYLVQEYGGDKRLELFPEELQTQAEVNRMLQFDMGTLTEAFVNLYSSWIFFNSPRTEYKQTKLLDALQIFDTILGKQSYAAGNSLTVADVALVANIVTIEAVGEDLTKYPKITEWINNCKTNITGFEDVNKEGLKIAKAKADKRREEELKDLDDGTVSNRDVFAALSTLLRGVKSQVISTKHFGYFKPLLDNVAPLIKA